MAVNKNMTIPTIQWALENTDTTIGMSLRSQWEIDQSDIEMRNGETRGNSRLDFRLGQI